MLIETRCLSVETSDAEWTRIVKVYFYKTWDNPYQKSTNQWVSRIENDKFQFHNINIYYRVNNHVRSKMKRRFEFRRLKTTNWVLCCLWFLTSNPYLQQIMLYFAMLDDSQGKPDPNYSSHLVAHSLYRQPRFVAYCGKAKRTSASVWHLTTQIYCIH